MVAGVTMCPCVWSAECESIGAEGAESYPVLSPSFDQGSAPQFLALQVQLPYVPLGAEVFGVL